MQAEPQLFPRAEPVDFSDTQCSRLCTVGCLRGRSTSLLSMWACYETSVHDRR